MCGSATLNASNFVGLGVDEGEHQFDILSVDVLALPRVQSADALEARCLELLNAR
jgi:hypothetical protein